MPRQTPLSLSLAGNEACLLLWSSNVLSQANGLVQPKKYFTLFTPSSQNSVPNPMHSIINASSIFNNGPVISLKICMPNMEKLSKALTTT